MKTRAKTEFGDFQTPQALADQVCGLLSRLIEKPDAIVEPTAGQGAFLLAAAKCFPKAGLHGWDINAGYAEEAKAALDKAGAKSRTQIHVQDFFDHDWERTLENIQGDILILGNPPWVTNAGLTSINSSNLPAKENFMGLRGLAARTGKANFDISEWMLIRLLQALRHRPATLAMLCKTSTARKFLRYAWRNDGRISQASLYHIDASYHFAAAVDACLLFLRTGSEAKPQAPVYSSLDAIEPLKTLGLSGRDLVSDLTAYRKYERLEGLCPFQWRSGIKHDCAAVMELRVVEKNLFANGLGESPTLEAKYLYPFLKCSDLANGRIVPRRAVIVTQKHVGDDTSPIAQQAPLTWRYLQTHSERFQARKSSIYKSSAPFALFGIGPYAFAPWKVAVSALHKTTRFQVVTPMRAARYSSTMPATIFRSPTKSRPAWSVPSSTRGLASNFSTR